MLHHIRVAMSRVFALWIIAIALMSPSPFTANSRPLISVGHVVSSLSAPTPMRSAPITRRSITVTRPTNATLCLAQALFFEAGTEPIEGLEAVAATVFNRTDHDHYASSICAVVYQPYQYSWTLIRENWKRRPPAVYMQMAKTFIQERKELQEEYPVTHFHHINITPAWSKTLEYVATIGAHKFYRG